MTSDNTWTALRVDVSTASWRQVFWQCTVWALIPLLVPTLSILSRIRGKPISLGVVREKRRDLGSLHCYRCGKGLLIGEPFALEVLKGGTPTALPEEATVCTECRDEHPECEYATGKDK